MEQEICKSKRGRPRKNLIFNKNEIKKMSINKQDEIVLFLPIPINDINVTVSNKIECNLLNINDNKCETTEDESVSIEKENKVVINILNDNNNVDYKNICCWWCTFTIGDVYYHIPDRCDDLTYHVYGYFCSPNCASAYNLDEDDYKSSIRHALLEKLYGNIISAPNWKCLEKFGGSTSIENFRKNFNNIKCNKPIKLIYSI